MENSEKTAFPISGVAFIDDYKGLTKREYLAGLVMQGYIVQRHAQDDLDRIKIVKWSIKIADELLKQLNENK